MGRRAGIAFILVCLTCPALAQVNVSMPWVRGAVSRQPATEAFMQLEAHVTGAVALVGAASPIAQSVEIRDSRGGKSGARGRVPRLELAAGKKLSLRPGGPYLLLQGLKQPIKKGQLIPITLLFETADGKELPVEISLEAMAPGAKGHWHKH